MVILWKMMAGIHEINHELNLLYPLLPHDLEITSIVLELFLHAHLLSIDYKFLKVEETVRF